MEMWMQYACLYSKHLSIGISALEKRKSSGPKGQKTPTVSQQAVHLEGKQNIFFVQWSETNEMVSIFN